MIPEQVFHQILQQQAEQNSDNPAPRYYCVGANCMNYANSFVNEANGLNEANQLLLQPPVTNVNVNAPPSSVTSP